MSGNPRMSDICERDDLTEIECVVTQHLIDDFGFIYCGVASGDIRDKDFKAVTLYRTCGFTANAKIVGNVLVLMDLRDKNRIEFDMADPMFFTRIEDWIAGRDRWII